MNAEKRKLWQAINDKLDEKILETLDALPPGEIDASLITAISKRGQDMCKGERAESPDAIQERQVRQAVKPLKIAGQ